jgi:NTE family protein
MKAFSNYTATLLNTPTYAPTFESRSRFLPNYRAPIFVAFGLKYQLPLFKHAALRTEVHGFKPLVIWEEKEKEILWSNLTPDYSLSAMAAFIYNTASGPVSLSTHYYDAPYPVSIFLNIGYLMFKESPLN